LLAVSAVFLHLLNFVQGSFEGTLKYIGLSQEHHFTPNLMFPMMIKLIWLLPLKLLLLHLECSGVACRLQTRVAISG
jgi:hypothetical protein